MADTTVVLGGLTLADKEIPEKINFGGKQQLIVQELVGGTRVVDSLGRSDATITWSGWFFGENALDRARAFDQMRINGQSAQLLWSDRSYEVVVESFTADWERFYQIPYTITLAVVVDYANPTGTTNNDDVDDQISGDISSATSYAASIGNSTLSSLMGTLQSATSAVSSFATASQSVLNSVLQPLAAVRTQVGTLLASAGNTVQNLTTLGGILPNNPIAKQVSNLTSAVSSMQQQGILLNMDRTLGRVQSNIASLGSGPTLQTAGGNLMQIASNVYQDATAWTTLARANNINDPQLSGVNTIVVPTTPDSSNGIPT